jgi:putative two-component system response regulator
MKPRILLVDDSEINLRLLEKLFRDDYELARSFSGEECLEKLRDFEPDLVLLDIMMAGMDGYETCRRIKSSPVGKFTQVILVSAKATTAERLKGYEVGADDYIVKPFDNDELRAKVRINFRLHATIEELWSASRKGQEFSAELERMVEERTVEVAATREIAIFSLAKLAESRDPETGEHLERMRNYSRILAEELGQRGPYREQVMGTFAEDIYQSSPLHDIGKVGIPDAILLKPGRLTTEEFAIMKTHTIIGYQSLMQTARHSDYGSFLKMAIDITRYHHERFNGGGYPDGLAGQQIPLSARIVALADVYDALTSARVYKQAYDREKARQIIEAESGQHFDPAIVEAFRASYDKFLAFLDATRCREGELVAADLSDGVRC